MQFQIISQGEKEEKGQYPYKPGMNTVWPCTKPPIEEPGSFLQEQEKGWRNATLKKQGKTVPTLMKRG